ncbi:MAG: glycoside hydrolase family 3 C-terminal domain-containing protein [Halioglobus sp.]|nr:glycoside hydrolase family 3 C-terminal domain-containing protein [Halioglobus sp.]
MAAETAAPWRDPDTPVEDRVNGLLESLTLEEKLALSAGAGFWKTRAVPRLGIRPFRLSDGPRGVGFHSSGKRCTAFPSGVAQAATWDPSLLHRFGEALGRECRAAGADTILAPAINIVRSPLCGRNFEYLSEDPFLNSRLVVPVVRGIQSQGVAACVKHYAANNQETNRVRISAEVSERALQEIYLPAFRAAVREGDAWSVMAAYNRVNGIPVCENRDLLVRRLREQWGFRGFVVSDWFAARFTSSTQACVRGGLSLEMPGRGSRYSVKKLREGLAACRFTEPDIDHNLAGLLRAMVLTGHLDGNRVPGARNTPAHRALAREMAESGITLLKNEGDLLPLDPARTPRVALRGPKLKKRNCLPLWGGSAGVWPPSEITPLEGLRQENRGRFQWVEDPARADVVLLFVGLSHRPGLDSEVKDRASLSLPWGQDDLVRETVTANSNTVVILLAGSPVAMPWAAETPGIVAVWYPGMEGGSAIARTLFGDNNPSGKLPVTFPKTLADSPAHRSPRTFPGDRKTVCYEEELFVGYRHFDKQGIEPLFPFGHGLSYTSFRYEDLRLSTGRAPPSDTIAVSADVINTGTRPGSEVVQLYVADLGAGPERPSQSLQGFVKLHLEPGQRQRISFDLPLAALKIYCPQAADWRAMPGEYEVRLGSSSRDIRLRERFVLTDGDNAAHIRRFGNHDTQE